MKRNRELKNRVHIHLSIDPQIAKKFRKLSEITEIPGSKLADRALTMLFEYYQQKGVNIPEE